LAAVRFRELLEYRCHRPIHRVFSHMDLQFAAQQILDSLSERFPLGYIPRIMWRAYRVSAGMAYYRQGVIGLSTIVITDEDKMRSTLIHEYAHLLAFSRHGKTATGHGEAWQQAMRDLGAEPRVRHTYPVLRNSARQEVAYKCERCGQLLLRTRRLPARRRYSHVTCGGRIKYAWTRAVTESANAT
jgi:predicted SprT family Zn-dependent metalloprotease